MQENWW